MNFRTDLAIEIKEAVPGERDGVVCEQLSIGEVDIIRMTVENERGERTLNRPRGKYITIEASPFRSHYEINEDCRIATSNELKSMLPKSGTVLVCGIGNTDITPDSYGPRAGALVLSTRHIGDELAMLGKLRAVAVICPGVLGQTGMETIEIIKGVADKIKPSAVIVIDALAARSLDRLGRTIQLSDTGLTPGSGVGNARQEISKRTLGIPVISVGVPTVVDACTMVSDFGGNCEHHNARNMVVTPKEIDLIISHAARLTAHAINCALQTDISSEDLLTLIS